MEAESSTSAPPVPAQPEPDTKSPAVGDKPANGTGSGKKGWPKGKKRKRVMKDLTAPRQPHTGYVRYMTERRETIRSEKPNMHFADVTKMLAAEWSALPQEKKQLYLDAAEQDRERYLQELAAYKKSEAYRIFSERQQLQEQQVSSKKVDPEEPPAPLVPDNETTGYDIPIFTEEFLEHNKGREAELRQLRKSNTDYEQQNATIQTYISGLQSAIDKLNVETQQQKLNNNALKQHLQSLRNAFISVLSNVHVPGLENPSLENIDSYVVNLFSYVRDNPSTSITASVRKAVLDMDLQT